MANEPPLAAVLTAWLLWCRCPRAGGLPASRDDTRSPLLATGSIDGNAKIFEGPKHCRSDSDCGDTTKLKCDLQTNLCTCEDTSYPSVLSPTGECLPVKQLGEACSIDDQCKYFDSYAACLNRSCACTSGIYTLPDKNGSSCDSGGGIIPGSPTQATFSAMDTNMIIIVVCLTVMFLGICVALHLFSKARFRNRRTIFNSPHPRLMHIKLGRKKQPQRRPSHINVPQAVRHHSFSVHQSPLPARPVHKTVSHECLRTAITSPKFDQRLLRGAPLAEKESLPSTEDLARKPPEPLKNSPAILKASAAVQNGPTSPTVIVTDADGSHTVVSSKSPSPPLNV